MGKFSGAPETEWLGPKLWRLTKRLSYHSYKLTPGEIAVLRSVGVPVSASGNITAPKDFISDLGTIPRILWAIFAPQDIAGAAIIHDLIYRSIKQYKHNIGGSELKITVSAKLIGDKVFKHAMNDTVPNIPRWKQLTGFWITSTIGFFCLRAKNYNLHKVGIKNE